MPAFTVPVHEHGDKGEPNYPHPVKRASKKADVERQIQRIVKQGKYAHFGVRVDNNPDLKAGDPAPTSSDWSDEKNPVRLAGTAAIEVSDWKRVINYSGKYIVLLGSRTTAPGTDRGEIVMPGAVVLGVWEMGEGFW